MSTTVDILCFYKHLYNQLLKVNNGFYPKSLIYVETLISQITIILGHVEVVYRGSKT